ncbi:MAG: FAD-dependent tricarballylate dehydrogenase TcuA [Candidatus Sedimenticola sp. PURPLELP]
MIDLDREYDVLVVGGGNAAMCAAISAAEAGASVLVTESAPEAERGGNSRHVRNLRVMHNEPTQQLTDSYSEEEYWDDLLRVTGGNTDEMLARMVIRESERAALWMKSQGVRFQASLGGTLSLSRTNPFFLGGGKALLNTWYANAERLGVTIAYHTEILELDIQDGRFMAARGKSRGAPCTLRAKSLVLASGGFESNIDWLEEAWGPAARNFIIRGTAFNQGKVLREILSHDANPIGEPAQCHAVAIDARAPKYDGGIVSRVDCVPFSIVVNRNAERFYDEGEDFWPKRYAIWGRLVAQEQEQSAYAIIDAKSAELFMPTLFPPEQGDTIEELAMKLQLDPVKLRETVDSFNAAVQPGTFDSTDLDDCTTEGLFPPKTHWARPLDTPPYFGYPLRTGITFTYLGVKVNEQAAVIRNNGNTFDNIFAAGEIMAGNVLGKGYLAGIGMTIGTVFGRIAGSSAATNSSTESSMREVAHG